MNEVPDSRFTEDGRGPSRQGRERGIDRLVSHDGWTHFCAGLVVQVSLPLLSAIELAPLPQAAQQLKPHRAGSLAHHETQVGPLVADRLLAFPYQTLPDLLRTPLLPNLGLRRSVAASFQVMADLPRNFRLVHIQLGSYLSLAQTDSELWHAPMLRSGQHSLVSLIEVRTDLPVLSISRAYQMLGFNS